MSSERFVVLIITVTKAELDENITLILKGGGSATCAYN